MFALANRLASHKKGVRSIVLRTLIVSMLTVQLAGSNVFVEHTYGATVAQGKVKVQSGKVRKSSTTASDVAFCVSNNETVAILSEEKGSDGKTWYKVAVGNSVGFIRSDLITKTEKKITVNDSLVPKAQESSASSNNNKNNTTANSNSNSSATTSESSTSIDKLGIIKGTYVRMRKEASVTSGIAKVMDMGDVVTILGEGKGADGQTWYQIKLGNTTGFVRGDFVSRGKTSSTNANQDSTNKANTNQETSNTSEKVYTTNDKVLGNVKGTSVRVRDKANTTSNVLTSVNTGTSFNVVGKIAAADREWYKIEVDIAGKTTTGYIAADYVELSKQEVTESNSEENKAEDEKKTEDEKKAEETENKQEEKVTVSDPNAKQGDLASIKGVGVRIREVPVTGNVMCQLSSGHPLSIQGDTTADDGNKWYQVAFSYQGSDKVGYVRSDFVIVSNQITETAPVGSEDFENSIAPLPDSYKNSLRALHQAHPSWTFEAVDTGLDWTASLIAESSVGKNLVSKNSIASWKSTAAQAYNWSSNSWYTFDGGSWVSASPELIAYYMDPRNFLNDSGIYQFESLDYKDTQKKESVAKMLTGTFMSNDVTDADGNNLNYAETFATIGQMVGVSPYLLAGRCIQEQGIYGKSNSIAGNVPGYEGYYNYFNIGAYAYSGRTATTNGLIYAMGQDDENLRPWNTRAKSIFGGAKFVADKYVSKGQNTLYFQKFNVVNSENTIYSHQYMNNIQAASSESARLQLAYLGDDEVLHFRIPYYSNMPEAQCAKPTSDSNPNTYLQSLTVDGYELTPGFSGTTENYYLTVDSSTEFININAAPVVASSAVGGTGMVQINPGTNVINIGVKAQSGAVKLYTITVQR